MFSHVTVGTRDLAAAARFYDAVFLPLGFDQREVEPDGGPPSRCWVNSTIPLPRFYVYEPFDGKPATPGNGVMIAFLAPSKETVDLVHAAAISAGGTDRGRPGPRERYGEGYYGTYFLDLDGNKIHVAFRGDVLTQT